MSLNFEERKLRSDDDPMYLVTYCNVHGSTMSVIYRYRINAIPNISNTWPNDTVPNARKEINAALQDSNTAHITYNTDLRYLVCHLTCDGNMGTTPPP